MKVLFVSLGGICRAPIAEAVLKEKCKIEGHQIEVDTAAARDWHVGEFPHEETVQFLTDKKIPFDQKESRQVRVEELETFDFILAMDAETVGELHRLAGMRQTGTIARLLDYVADQKEVDIPDPYLTGNFNEAFNLVTIGCEHFIKHKMKRDRLF
ncbi:low molecular weight protein-tyrosine-phosphatase [Pseudalkalibacillus salsuginis]|uniref:low molecular weight protein-tyrosine-phosphatase n=1 Tax=Pseudalkalibacillus salsuginis TaxID=2910972 RepID=UPI001F2394EC|nr:low molecular weight protein-tyrosine-phosphatase [Pseudalkalibacillus salsuginis]MCF6411239.1 low molecular weight phosphotyrosine protein phosphatase [Pseudalkalibacillus salsuginis]